MQIQLHITTRGFWRDELDKYHILMLLPVSSNMASCHALSTSQFAVVEASVNSLSFLQIEF